MSLLGDSEGILRKQEFGDPKRVLREQELFFRNVYRHKRFQHVSEDKRKPVYTLDQAFQLLNCERSFFVHSIARPVEAYRCKSGNWIQSAYLRVYSTYRRTRSKPLVRKTFILNDIESRQKRRTGHLYHRHYWRKRRIEKHSLQIYWHSANQYNRERSAGRNIWSQYWPLDLIDDFLGRIHQSWFGLFEIYAPGRLVFQNTHGWTRR